ncbi:MAG: hypothetical protein J07HQW2_01243 [Haloquadratum walsbyi J07HQW2]|jgi:hypothetical protein|uniref:Uncharacterized protein n=1 Tax=Haloquadratum walsbyi J07HQW2 TaxID=1238425 RepID=U1PR39_9EURY|nr:MAG: hypothetical protein J07HQW2_01243 [Haloquadratum walsbyi J07HQW2]
MLTSQRGGGGRSVRRHFGETYTSVPPRDAEDDSFNNAALSRSHIDRFSLGIRNSWFCITWFVLKDFFQDSVEASLVTVVVES